MDLDLLIILVVLQMLEQGAGLIEVGPKALGAGEQVAPLDIQQG